MTNLVILATWVLTNITTVSNGGRYIHYATYPEQVEPECPCHIETNVVRHYSIGYTNETQTVQLGTFSEDERKNKK